MATEQMYNQTIIEEYVITDEPYYLPLADEIEIFEAAYHQRVPVLLKGPTGTGKTRFVEHMAWRLGEELTVAQSGRQGRSQFQWTSRILAARNRGMSRRPHCF